MKKFAIFIIFVLGLENTNFSQNLDIDLLRKINIDRNAALDPAFKLITNSVSPIGLGAPLIVTSIGFIQKDQTLKNKGYYIGATLLTSALITTTLKFTIDKDRPFVTYPEIQKLTGAGSPSFPSGHTSEAFATATSLSIAFPKWYVIAPSFLWASAAGYSRMHLGVHYPSDVLVGALIGSGSAWLCHELNKWYFK
ncbi:MAG: phosphatase PAP2 family protein [Crocinitomicaceae bacterium]|jgi:membrane-associated phospholipid phosphatase|nr:phosphatase PAP2 family protein [Crocinitomicaceae bacterium]MDP4739871.1 phosphatase PAP2 family protein [Crocinitomicaceae bacterium]MDP4799582.1 phosphatase PAP2 family protein [Crocinitomicaceae bacterium]MDP4805531.1 phosphatase PAP2 family protein [Crocinitomicaceae bacterium]